MSAAAGERITPPGSAQHLPAGRLASFEDGDDAAVDLAAILTRRARQRSATTDDPAAQTEQAASAAPPDAPPDTAAPVKRARARTAKAPGGSKPAVVTVTDAPRPDAQQNRIRSTTVHIPSPLIERVVNERSKSGRSNGQIVIAALEHSHSRLAELIKPPQATGGGLFTARASQAPRVHEGLLTPFNVRLFEADYTVIDDLVHQFGARSRGHLMSVALNNYLPH